MLGIAVGDVPPQLLGNALRDVVPELAAFALGFALVASIWWQHHKSFSRLALVDPPLLAWTVVGLALVALVPFPTGMLGSYPTSRVAVIVFSALFAILIGVFGLSTRHAHRARLWRGHPPDVTYRRVIAGYLLTGATMGLAMVVAWWSPLGGLVLLAGSNVPERLLARSAPSDYRAWSWILGSKRREV